jgi:hypothetical protein
MLLSLPGIYTISALTLGTSCYHTGLLLPPACQRMRPWSVQRHEIKSNSCHASYHTLAWLKDDTIQGTLRNELGFQARCYMAYTSRLHLPLQKNMPVYIWFSIPKKSKQSQYLICTDVHNQFVSYNSWPFECSSSVQADQGHRPVTFESTSLYPKPVLTSTSIGR